MGNDSSKKNVNIVFQMFWNNFQISSEAEVK